MENNRFLFGTNEEYAERLELAIGRLKEMVENPEVSSPYKEYFAEISNTLLLLNEVADTDLDSLSLEELKEINEKVFGRIKPDAYANSFSNPKYSVEKIGEDYGQLLSVVFSQLAKRTEWAFKGVKAYICIFSELVIELYNYFVNEDELEKKEVEGCFYWFMHDYAELFTEESIELMYNPANDYETDIVMNADLSKPDYLYKYGLNVTENELQSREHIASFSDEEIESMASTYTEGFRIGFETTNKDLSSNDVVQLIYPIGFERVVRVAVKNFEKMGLKPVMLPESTSPNKQFDFDHKEDSAVWMDKAYVEYNLECYHNAFEKLKDITKGCAGPAVIEVFGEVPFEPENKKENPSFSDKQQQLQVHFRSEFSQMTYKYIRIEDRSFTIIAYPVADIGEKYKEIFTETVKLNTLDYIQYRDVQQKIIDVLDTADRVHIVGNNGNKTDLYVKVFDLQNPAEETAFENCVADVNIPVGEVFTSPVLKGTEGKLHVSQVYLEGLNYLNFEMDFVDGCVANYTCTNFEDEAENKKYILDNVLKHHETLPMGEFAIGTNTTAYKMARVYDIAATLPILIAEKTGPHFAVGDTCYSHDEDNMTKNADGKKIVARENDFSALRNEDPSKAYFNCHTDITIPYDELGAITVIRKDGTTEDIIRDGRFVLAGTDFLNEPLDELAKMK